MSSSASSVSSAAVGARVLQGGALGGRRLSVGEKKKTSRKVKRGANSVQNDKHGPTTAASMQVLEDTLMLGSPPSSSVYAAQMPPSFDLDASASSSSCGLSSGGSSSSIESSPLQQRLPQQRVVASSSRSGANRGGSSVVSPRQQVGDSAASWNGSVLGQSYYSQWRMPPNANASSLLTHGGFSAVGGAGLISPTGGDLASIVGSIPVPSGNSDTVPISLGASSSTNYVERAMNQRRSASMRGQGSQQNS